MGTTAVEKEIRKKFGRFKQANRDYRVCCHKCSDKRFRLYLTPHKNMYHCFNCECSGRLSSLLGSLPNWKFVAQEPGYTEMGNCRNCSP